MKVGAKDACRITSPRSAAQPSFTSNEQEAQHASAHAPISRDAGLTLIELIITVAVLSVLTSAALPVARFQVKREKEKQLRRDLWSMRDAIDHYKDAADKGGIQTKADSFNYPPDLQTLVDGVDVQTKKVRFLRSIPTDPMTNSTDWGRALDAG